MFRAGAGVALSKTDFVTKVTDVYSKDVEGFKKEIAAAFRNLIPIIDTNLDCVADSNEFILAMQVVGHNDKLADMKYFKSFNASQGVPISDLINAWVNFQTNTASDAGSGAIETYFD